jgi:hypothetical protein
MSFHGVLPELLKRDDAAGVLRAIAELPAGVDVIKVLRYGFEHDGKNASFAQLCVAYRAVNVLEQVAATAPGGVTLNDITHWKAISGWSDREEYRSLAHASVLASVPAGLALALRHQPESADLSRLLSYTPHHASPHSLHFAALHRAVSKSDMAEHLLIQRAMAQQLREHGAPLKVGLLEGPAAGAEAFFGRKWTSPVVEENAQLLRSYFQDGLVEIDKPVRIIGQPSGNHLPMVLAMLWSCAPLARELITLGCDLQKAMDAVTGTPGTEVDMVLAAQAMKHPAAAEAALVSAITEGLMQRRLNELAQGNGQALAQNEQAGPTPVSRRKMRSTL